MLSGRRRRQWRGQGQGRKQGEGEHCALHAFLLILVLALALVLVLLEQHWSHDDLPASASSLHPPLHSYHETGRHQQLLLLLLRASGLIVTLPLLLVLREAVRGYELSSHWIDGAVH